MSEKLPAPLLNLSPAEMARIAKLHDRLEDLRDARLMAETRARSAGKELPKESPEAAAEREKLEAELFSLVKPAKTA
jgi:hypothetical protein